MAYKMKGVFKGLKVISQIFVVKEHQMEIGYPTDVKHVTHIGWDSPTGSAASPSWMNDMKGSPDFSSLNNFGPSTGTSWTSQDFDHPQDISPFGIYVENAAQEANPHPDIPKPPRKSRKKKSKNNSPTASSRSSSCHLREIQGKTGSFCQAIGYLAVCVLPAGISPPSRSGRRGDDGASRGPDGETHKLSRQWKD
ncbi:hypothetical protein ABZP36_026995 [Zizania latifolia]